MLSATAFRATAATRGRHNECRRDIVFELYFAITAMLTGRCIGEGQALMDVTYEAMMAGINAVQPGASLGDIGFAIQQRTEINRLAVVRDFCGHGLGRVFHDTPNILHCGRPGEGLVLREGMTFHH